MRRFLADPTGWTEGQGEGMKSGAEWYSGMSRMFNPEGVAQMMHYHIIRSNIQEHQQEHGISAKTGTEAKRLFGQEVEIYSFADQLAFLPEDLPLIRENAQKLVQLVLDVMPTHIHNYNCFHNLDGDEKEWCKAQLSDIEELRDRIVECSLHSEAYDLEPIPGNPGLYKRVNCDRDSNDEPDLITFGLGLDDLIVGTGYAVNNVTFEFWRERE